MFKQKIKGYIAEISELLKSGKAVCFLSYILKCSTVPFIIRSIHCSMS